MVKRKYFVALIFYDFWTFLFGQERKTISWWVGLHYTQYSVLANHPPPHHQTHLFSLIRASSLYSPLTNCTWHTVDAQKCQLLSIFITHDGVQNALLLIFWRSSREDLSDLPWKQVLRFSWEICSPTPRGKECPYLWRRRAIKRNLNRVLAHHHCP